MTEHHTPCQTRPLPRRASDLTYQADQRALKGADQLAGLHPDLVFIDADDRPAELRRRGVRLLRPRQGRSCTGRRWAVGPVIPGARRRKPDRSLRAATIAEDSDGSLDCAWAFWRCLAAVRD